MTASKSLAILRKIDAVSLGSPLKFKANFKIQRFEVPLDRFVTFFYLNQACFPDSYIFHRIHLCTHHIHKEQIEHSKLPS